MNTKSTMTVQLHRQKPTPKRPLGMCQFWTTIEFGNHKGVWTSETYKRRGGALRPVKKLPEHKFVDLSK